MIWQSFFLLNKYLFIVSKCLVDSIEIFIKIDYIFSIYVNLWVLLQSIIMWYVIIDANSDDLRQWTLYSDYNFSNDLSYQTITLLITDRITDEQN